MKTNVLIVEDEPSARKHLIALLKNQELRMEVLACLSTVEDSIRWLQQHPIPDLVFMDIQLSDGLSFDILGQMPIDCPIIFTTAYDQYAIRAFRTTGIAYLLKPVTLEDITRALKKYVSMKTVQADWVLKNLDVFAHYQKQNQVDYKERFLLKSGNSLVPVTTDQIAYFFRDEIVFAKTFEGKVHPIEGSLNLLQTQLDPTRFIRLNRRVLVQVEAIVQLKHFKPGQFQVKLKPQYHETIQISQERSSWLKRFLDKEP